MNTFVLPRRCWQPVARRLATAGAPSLAAASRMSSAKASTKASPKSPPAACRQCRQLLRPGSHRAPFSTAGPARRPQRQGSAPADAEPLQPADDPNFTSIVDNPPELVRSGRRHGPGLIVLAIIPITAFALGTWQVFRLRWKTDLLAKCEDRLVQPPLPLTPENVHAAVAHSQGGPSTAGEGDSGGGSAADFDYRRIVAVGTFRHDQEMLVGPRMHEGTNGYFVVTPLEIEGEGADGADGADGATAKVLVNRGWIAREQQSQARRARVPGGLPQGRVRVEGMLRAPWKRNMFTPANRPDKGEFYFPDVAEMAQLTGSLPVWVEATMEPDLLQVYDMEAKGVPIGKPAEVNLRNNHAQYIFTWYSLSLATAVMLWMVARKPPSDIHRRVRMNKNW